MDNVKSLVDDFLYAACVTSEHYDNDVYAKILLYTVCNHKYEEKRYNGKELIVINGNARNISHLLPGYKDACMGGKDIIAEEQRKIDEDFFRELYNQMHNKGYITQNQNGIPDDVEEIFNIVNSNIECYINDIVMEAKEIHDEGIKKKGNSDYANLRVSLALSNHYLDKDWEKESIPEEKRKFGTIEEEEKKALRLFIDRQRNNLEEDGVTRIEFVEDNLSKLITGDSRQEVSIKLGNDLYATANRGTRKEQQDAVLLIKDTENENFKMMVVADGVGGVDNGKEASNYLVKALGNWFRELSSEQKKVYYSNVNKLQNALDDVIKMISETIKNKVSGQTTFTCVIVGETQTLVANIGNSRACTIKNGQLKDVTELDVTESVKEDIPDRRRFRKDRNRITASVGGRYDELHFKVLNNDQYDMILMFTDGVTDLLEDNEIIALTRERNTDDLSQRLVSKVFEKKSIVAPEDISDNYDYDAQVESGDNATAAVLVNDSSNLDERV